MTIKQWNIPSQWQEPFVAKLTERGATGAVVNAALEAIDDKCKAEGEKPLALFGEPVPYAESVILPNTKAAAQSRVRAIALAVIGLIGMFLALWGWAEMRQDTDEVLGMAPAIPFAVGLLLVLGAAIADAERDFAHDRVRQLAELVVDPELRRALTLRFPTLYGLPEATVGP